MLDILRKRSLWDYEQGPGMTRWMGRLYGASTREKSMFSGSIPALVTPFRDGAIDEDAFRRLVDWQIENGSKALVPCGTTGEAPTISSE